jgi:hypothetical protein
VGFLLDVEEQICESLEGRLKAAIVTFNYYWRAEEVGSKPILAYFFPCCKLACFLC